MPTYTYTRLQEVRCDPDENASALVPNRCLQNLKFLIENRHPGAGFLGTPSTRAFSTHPRAWWGFPLAVPASRGATTLKVALALEAFTIDGSVRITCNGSTGATQTVTAGAGVQWVTCSVDYGNANRESVGTIQFQSAVDTGSSTSLTVNSGTGNQREIASFGASTGIVHKVMHFPSADANENDQRAWHGGYRHIGYTHHGAGGNYVRHWPSAENETWADNGDPNKKPQMYDITSFKLYGFTWWLEGAEVGDIVREDQIRPGLPVVAAHLQDINDATREILRSRTYVSMANQAFDDLGSIVSTMGSTVRVGHAVLPGGAQSSTTAYEAVGWVLPTGPTNKSYKWRSTSGSSADDALPVVADDVDAMDVPSPTYPNYQARTSLESAGTLPRFAIRRSTRVGYASGDLLHLAPGPSDLDRLQFVSTTVNVSSPSELANENYIECGVLTGGDISPIWGGQIRQRREDLGPLDGSTAVQAGEVIRGNTGGAVANGPARLVRNIHDAKDDTTRALISFRYWGVETIEATSTVSPVTFVARAPIRTSPEIAGNVFQFTVIAVNLALTIDVYDTSDTLIATDTVSTTGSAQQYGTVTTSATLSASLSSDSTYYLKLSGVCITTPGVSASNGRLWGFSMHEKG